MTYQRNETPEPKPSEETRPKCAVRGLIQPRAMCSMVIVGGEFCGFAGKCPHKILPTPAQEGQP